jgi:uncharacterized repeat protein (TIGR01451 family)
VGEAIQITASAVALGEAQDTLARNSFDYTQVLSCAIDPNDKQVLPARPEPSNSNYTQFDETLIYTIRFQNTGTDTAFNVLLKDRLANRLDYCTFKPLTSSHEFRSSIRDRDVEFFFKNIMLPDSNVNEPLSHGFVTFEIKLDGERTIGALIRNEADIYFDYNEAIRTNQIKSRIVEFLDEDQNGFFFYDECDDQNPDINPDRYDIPGNGIDENCDNEDSPVSTTSPLSGQLSVFPNPAHQQLNLTFSDNRELVAQLYDLLGREHTPLVYRRNASLSLNNLPAGTYLLKVTDALKGETSVQRVIRR